jgi:hypothetical protein
MKQMTSLIFLLLIMYFVQKHPCIALTPRLINLVSFQVDFDIPPSPRWVTTSENAKNKCPRYYNDEESWEQISAGFIHEQISVLAVRF